MPGNASPRTLTATSSVSLYLLLEPLQPQAQDVPVRLGVLPVLPAARGLGLGHRPALLRLPARRLRLLRLAGAQRRPLLALVQPLLQLTVVLVAAVDVVVVEVEVTVVVQWKVKAS